MSSPSSPTLDESLAETQRSPLASGPIRSRTLAIIKTHALQHRFEIEQRISEAGFEIVKERQMEFDIDTDPDTLYELFGEDFESFADGPVWVYVLERRRAVEVWHTLMGDVDPEVARQETTNSLRALYGVNRLQNAVMGSPNDQIADVQIESIFVSSPPFPLTDLPDVSGAIPTGSLRSLSSSVLYALQQNASENGYSASNGTAGNEYSQTSNGKGQFRARPLPVTHDKPDIVPRMSRAAALRAGIALESPRHIPASKESLAKTFANVPGHKRAGVIQVASTAPPAIAPRMTKAAALRLGQKTPPKPARSRASTSNVITAAEEAAKLKTFEGVPGHKRRESIAVASTKPPTVAPRTNRSAALRVQKESAPPTSFMFREHTSQSRSSSRNSMNPPSTSRPSVIQRPASATSSPQRPATAPHPRLSSSTSSRPSTARPSISSSRPSISLSRPSISSSRPSISSRPPTATTPTTKTSHSPNENQRSMNGSAEGATKTPVAKAKPRVSTALPPTIAPRTNRSAALRAAKMALDAAGTDKTPAKKGVKKPAATPRAIRI